MSYNQECILSGIRVIPSYGYNICNVVWSPSPVVGNTFAQVWKSRDGYTDWFLSGTVQTSAGVYVDPEFKNSNQAFNWHYKIKVVTGDQTPVVLYESPSVGIFDAINNEDFAALKQMLYTEAMAKDLTQVYLCRPKGMENSNMGSIPDTVVSTVNLITGDKVGIATDTAAYGKSYQGGFSTPIRTLIKIITNVTKHTDSENGIGYRQDNIVEFRTFAYPVFLKGDMIVDVKTDNRWIFEDVDSYEMFKGLIPFMFTGRMMLLPRNAIEYKYPLRQILIDGGCL